MKFDRQLGSAADVFFHLRPNKVLSKDIEAITLIMTSLYCYFYTIDAKEVNLWPDGAMASTAIALT